MLTKVLLTKEQYSFLKNDIVVEIFPGWMEKILIPCFDEVQDILSSEDFLYKYSVEVKIIDGELHFNDDINNNEVIQIYKKYTNLARYVCAECGDIAVWKQAGWNTPLCDIHAATEFIKFQKTLHSNDVLDWNTEFDRVGG